MNYLSLLGCFGHGFVDDNTLINTNSLFSKKNLPTLFYKIINKTKSPDANNIKINPQNLTNNVVKIKNTLSSKKIITKSNEIPLLNAIKKNNHLSQINLRKTKVKNEEELLLFLKKMKKMKQKEEKDEIPKKYRYTNIQNLQNLQNNNSNLSCINSINTTILSRPIKCKSKTKYNKKFKDGCAKIRGLLSDYNFINKQNINDNKLLVGKSSFIFFPHLKQRIQKEQLNNIISKYTNPNEKSVNLYMVSIFSPNDSFQKNILSFSRNNLANSQNPKKNSKSLNNKEEKKNINFFSIKNLYNDILYNSITDKKRNNLEQKDLIECIRNFNRNTIKVKAIGKKINYNKSTKRPTSTRKNFPKLKKNNLFTAKKMEKTIENSKLFPLIRIDNFREKYAKNEEVEKKFLSKKIIELFFSLYKEISLRTNILENIDVYHYKLNRMYNEQLTSYMSHRINWELVENNNYYIDYYYDYEESFEEEDDEVVNFEWKYYSNKLYYKKYQYNASLPVKKLCCVNLFEKNYEIGNKKKMFLHLINYCDKVKLNVFNYVPFTVVISNTKFIEDQ